MLTIMKGLAQAVMAGLTAHVVGGNFSGGLYGAYLMLWTAAAKTSPDALRTDLTEATFTGYARAALTPLGAPYVTADGRIAQDFAAVNFQASDAVTPNVILGWAIVDAAVAGNLLALEVLPSGVPLANGGDGFTITPRVELPETADWGEAALAL